MVPSSPPPSVSAPCGTSKPSYVDFYNLVPSLPESSARERAERLAGEVRARPPSSALLVLPQLSSKG